MPFIDHQPPPPPPCMSREHNPPTGVLLPAGSHTWQCPSCGHETTFFVPSVVCSV